MPTEQRQVVKIFLASPSDLAAERIIAKEIVDKINAHWADFFSLHIELVGWEDSVSVYGRPQDTINQDLARCEFFIGMLWHEWGKPNGRYDSGFEEEFRLSEKSLQQSGRPAISLLFKNMDQSRLRDAGPGLTRVLKFKEEINGKILYKTFGDENEFRERFELVVTDYIQKLKLAERREPAQEAPVLDKGASPDSVTQETEDQPQIPYDALRFIRQFAAKAEKSEQDEPVDTVDVARFRLLGTFIGQQGNDETLLGVHDANVLFVHSRVLSLTFAERSALVDCGLAHFDSENVPYWKWLAAVNEFDNFIPHRTLFGSAACKVGALKLMRLMQLEIPGREIFGRSEYLEYWFGSETSHLEREAALRYLSELGTSNDLHKVKEEIDRADYQTVKSAIHTYVSISLKESAEKSLEALVNLQPDSIESQLVERVFAKPSILSTSLLEECLSHKAPQLRARAAASLRERQALSREAAESLSNDADPEVRLQGLLGRAAAGEPISEQTAQAVLVKRKSTRPGLGALAFMASSTEGETQLEKFKANRLRGLTRAELHRESSIATIFDQEYKFEEIRRSFKKHCKLLRDAVKDQFKNWFTDVFEDVAKTVGAETLQKIKELEGSLRKQWTRDALNILVAKGDCQDLPLLRQALTSEYVVCNEHDIRFFAKCGEWQDVEIILRFSKSSASSNLRNLFGPYLSDADIILLSESLLSIAKNRVRDLLTLPLDARTKAGVIAKIPAKGFTKLTAAEILELLKSDSDIVRRAASLRSVASLPKNRLSSLLGSYLALPSSRYYNVILWLDLGVSVERHLSVSIAKRALNSDT